MLSTALKQALIKIISIKNQTWSCLHALIGYLSLGVFVIHLHQAFIDGLHELVLSSFVRNKVTYFGRLSIGVVVYC